MSYPNASCPKPSQCKDVANQEDLWDGLLNQHLQKLGSNKSSHLVAKYLEHGSFSETLRDLDKHARRCAVPSRILRLKPALEHLEIFTNAINNLVQTKSNPLGLIWGGISALLAVCFLFAVMTNISITCSD